MDETGFEIGTSQCSHVVVDTTLRTRYKLEPGRQEWVTAVECICGDGSALLPLVIFQADSISNSWISSDTAANWHWAASQKGWTTNIHGLEWLQWVFELATREKASGRQRLLICDGHDSHIAGSFIAHCMEYRITLLVIPPHSSHLLQPADVAVFGPLATYHAQETDHLTRTGVRCLSKAEWVQIYATARSKALTKKNILSAWRGAGLIPFNRHKVLQHLPSYRSSSSTPPPPPLPALPLPARSSPPESQALRQHNTRFKHKISDCLLSSPTRQYAINLAGATERLAAQVSILRTTNKAQEAILNARKRRGGKRGVVQGQFMLTTSEIRDKVLQAEAETAAKKRKKQRVTRRKKIEELLEEEENTLESSSDDASTISECIAVSGC